MKKYLILETEMEWGGTSTFKGLYKTAEKAYERIIEILKDVEFDDELDERYHQIPSLEEFKEDLEKYKEVYRNWDYRVKRSLDDKYGAPVFLGVLEIEEEDND